MAQKQQTMRTIKRKVYTAKELQRLFPDAFETAKYNSSTNCDWLVSDAIDSIKACLAYFDAELRRYSIDISCPPHSDFSIRHEINDEMTGVRLFKYLTNNYPGISDNWFPSGLCYDQEFLQPFVAFLKKPCKYTNIDELLENGVNNVIHAANSEYEYQTSDDGFIEMADANGYEFFEDGTLV